MNRKILSTLLTAIGLIAAISCSGCSATGSGFASSPVFPSSGMDYSSQLEKYRSRESGSPYLPPGGFDDAPHHGPMFSIGTRNGSGSRSGSC